MSPHLGRVLALSAWRARSAPRWSRRAGTLTAIGLAAALAATATTAPATTSKHGGTFTMISPGAPNGGLDPATGNTSQSVYTPWAYDPLFVWEANGTIKPNLVASYKDGPRNLSFSMTLRPGIRFSDGSRLNAAALRAWFQYADSVSGGGGQQYLKQLSGIKVTGPLSLKLTFKTPTPLLPRILSQVFTVGSPASPRAIAAKSLGTATDGAGEYVLDQSQTVSGDHYTYLPNPYYWNKPAVHWKKVVVKVIAGSTTTLNALTTGQAQFAAAQPVTSLSAGRRAGFQAATPATAMMAVVLADRAGKLAAPLADVRVRQALNYAINRKAMASALGGGAGIPIDQMELPGDDGFNLSLQSAYPYNPAKAKQLLAAAGYPTGFTLTIATAPVCGIDTFAQAVAGQLANIGVTVKVDDLSVSDWYTSVVKAQYPAFAVCWGSLPSPIEYALLWGPFPTLGNPFATANAQLATLYGKMNASSAAQEKVFARETQKVLVNQAWFLPVFGSQVVYFYSRKVTGVDAGTGRNNPYMPEIRPA